MGVGAGGRGVSEASEAYLSCALLVRLSVSVSAALSASV